MKKERGLRFVGLFSIFCLSFFIFVACDGSVFYDESRRVDEQGWLPEESVDFDVKHPSPRRSRTAVRSYHSRCMRHSLPGSVRR